MFSIPPSARCDPIFGKEGTAFLNLTIRTPFPKIGSLGDVVDSYHLEENDMLFTIHTLNTNEGVAYHGTSIF